MAKTIEETYQHLSQQEHLLKRPGMYIGSIKNELKSFFLYDTDESQLLYREIEYVPGLLKLCDEVISNSCDEFRRKNNMGLTEITVKIDNNGHFSVKDNGGVPVVKHKEANMMLPAFIFSTLNTSSNYDDSEARDVVGTNGLGGKISAIFSHNFIVFTADGKKSYYHSWSNNLQKDNNDETIKPCKEHFTELTYDFDLSRFEDIEQLSDDFIDLVERRCIDAAAANIGLIVNFEHLCEGQQISKSTWSFNDFEEYIELYSNYINTSEVVSMSDKQKSVWFFPDGNINIGFVNGAECSAGTHIKAIHSIVNDSVSSYITSKKKLDIQSKMIEGKYSTFCIMHVDNPSYDSQTKDTLTTPVSKFDTTVDKYEFTLPKKFIDDVCKSDLIDVMIDWFKQRQEVEDQKKIRQLNKDAKKKIARNDKFIDANSRERADRELWIFEGDSAQAGFRMARNPQTQAAYMLRGVIQNVGTMSATKIMQNKELSDLVSIIGLQWGVRNKKEDLKFNRLVIATDADHDGSHIAGLLLVFFNRFPELFDYEMVCRSISPIMIASKGNQNINIYTYKEFKEREDELKGYFIKYAKGLGSLNNQQYKEMMQKPMFHFYTKDELAEQSMSRWFGKNAAKERKQALKHEV